MRSPRQSIRPRIGGLTTPTRDRLDARRADFLGELLAPDDGAYEQARDIWNGQIDRRPALIARCTGVPDVTAAVRFGRDRELAAAVRCEVAAEAPDELGIMANPRPAPAVPIGPEELHGKPIVALVVCYHPSLA